jgi:hypothetical protein
MVFGLDTAYCQTMFDLGLFVQIHARPLFRGPGGAALPLHPEKVD